MTTHVHAGFFAKSAPIFALTSVLALVGCSGEVGGDASTDSTEAPEAAEMVGSTTQAVSIPNPNGAYFAEINANGTGCPAGTWNADISPDGETFTLTFSAYETKLNRGQFISVKDCQIGIKLHSPQGLSYSVANFDYAGYAALDSTGMVGNQSATYYFQGDRVDSSRGRTSLLGIYDGEYTYRDEIGLADRVWSPCGVDRMLNIATRIVLKNNSGRTGSGYINTMSVDGSLKLVFRLAWRTC